MIDRTSVLCIFCFDNLYWTKMLAELMKQTIIGRIIWRFMVERVGMQQRCETVFQQKIGIDGWSVFRDELAIFLP